MEPEHEPDPEGPQAGRPGPRPRGPSAPGLPAFRPPTALRSGKLMTLVGALPRPGLRSFDAAGAPEVFPVGDGSAVVGVGNWHPGPGPRPTAVVLHGLTGSARSGYAVGTAAKLYAEGFHVLRLNARNCGGTEALATTIYHAALVDDPLHVLVDLARRPTVGRLYLAGFSMGGNLALLLAATRRSALPARVAGLAAVSPPLDLAASSRRCASDRFNRLLSRRFLRDLGRLLERREAERRAAGRPGRIDLSRFDPEMTMWAFDAAFTAPLAGFGSVEEYYAAGSAAGRLADVALPGLLVHAADDPLIGPEPFLAPELGDHPRLEVALTRHGGHVGFVAAARAAGPRGRDRDRRWAEGRVVDFLVGLERRAAEGAPMDVAGDVAGGIADRPPPRVERPPPRVERPAGH